MSEPVSVDQRAGGRTVKLSGEIGVALAAELHSCALALASTPGDVLIDLSQAEHLDTAAWQILLALDSALRARSAQLRFVGTQPRHYELVTLAAFPLSLEGSERGG